MRQLLVQSGLDGGSQAVGLYNLGVDFEYRRQGIASALLDYTCQVARELRWAGGGGGGGA